ncbi:hypothetical protein [Streptomyces spiralis]|uniref:hypothetical protein n=1 Tax=Streptomyces spiralis TaxID=66376 RepID=UPI0033F0CDFC
MDLAYDDFALPGDPHVSITTYTADPGTPSTEGLTLPAIWADTEAAADHQRRGTPHPPPTSSAVRSPRPVTSRPSWSTGPARPRPVAPLRSTPFEAHAPMPPSAMRRSRSTDSIGPPPSEALGPVGAVGGRALGALPWERSQ